MKERLFTLENAKSKNQNDKLVQWTIDYLLSEGNNHKLATALANNQIIAVTLTEFPLQELKRVIGPEPEMLFFENAETWQERVGGLVEALKNNAELPPLIVTDMWDNFNIADGGHRYQALKQCGVEKYWTIFLFTKYESQKFLEDKLLR